MWTILLFLAAGMLIGFRFTLPDRAKKVNGWLQTIGVILLLFSMGISIGANEEIIGNLRQIGVVSMSFAFFAAFFSIGLAIIASFFLKKKGVL